MPSEAVIKMFSLSPSCYRVIHLLCYSHAANIHSEGSASPSVVAPAHLSHFLSLLEPVVLRGGGSMEAPPYFPLVAHPQCVPRRPVQENRRGKTSHQQYFYLLSTQPRSRFHSYLISASHFDLFELSVLSFFFYYLSCISEITFAPAFSALLQLLTAPRLR